MQKHMKNMNKTYEAENLNNIQHSIFFSKQSKIFVILFNLEKFRTSISRKYLIENTLLGLDVSHISAERAVAAT
jgi:hypothetical protein